MCISALIMGISSISLFFLFKANFEFIYKHGRDAIMDGALRQLLELCFYSIISMLSYIVFKSCERVSVDKILK